MGRKRKRERESKLSPSLSSRQGQRGMNVYGAPGCQRANQPARAGINLPRAPEGISRLFSLYPSARSSSLAFASYSTLSRPSSRILNQTRDESQGSIPAWFIPGQTSTSSTRLAKVNDDYKFTMYIYGVNTSERAAGLFYIDSDAPRLPEFSFAIVVRAELGFQPTFAVCCCVSLLMV